jgi:hypothetical protein
LPKSAAFLRIDLACVNRPTESEHPTRQVMFYRRPERERYNRQKPFHYGRPQRIPGRKMNAMSFFDGMKYVSGFDGENPRFAIPLNPDDDGLLGRECPTEHCTPKYFKITVASEDDVDAPPLTDTTLRCPYCGHTDNFQEFHTQAQIDWATDLVVHEVENAAVRSLKKSLRPLNNMRGPIRITAKVTALAERMNHYRG